MIWFAAALFAAIAVVLLAAREPFARGLALVMGGRMGVGCVVAMAVAFLIMAVLTIVFRASLA